MSDLPLIQYNSDTERVDFLRKLNINLPARMQRKIVNIVLSGVEEHINFYEQESLRVGKRMLSPQELAQLEDFWAYAKDGSTFKVWRNRDLGGYWSFEGESLNSNDEDAATFTRSGTPTLYHNTPVVGHEPDLDSTAATSTKTADGTAPTQLQVAESLADTPRFVTGKFGRAILVERDVQNELDDTDAFNAASWTSVNITVTGNTAEVQDPAGGNTANKLTATAANGYISQDGANPIGGNSSVFSVWLRAQTRGTLNVELYIDDDTGAGKAFDEVSVTEEWQRFIVPYTNPGTDTDNWRVRILVKSNGDVIYAWGAQLEAVGSQELYATTYIKDNGSRSAETLYWDDANDKIFNRMKGTLNCWIKHPWTYDNGRTRVLIQIQDPSGNAAISLENTSGDVLQVVARDEAGTAFSTANGGTSSYLTANQWDMFTVTWDFTVASGLLLYHNAILKGTGSTTQHIPRRLYRLNLTGGISSFFSDSAYDDLCVWKRVLSLAEITSIYNRSGGLGFRKNYWSSMILDDQGFTPEQIAGSDRYNWEWTFNEEKT